MDVGGVYHETVLGAATGVLAGFDHKGSVGGELALVMGEGLLDEFGGDHVHMDRALGSVDAVAVQHLGDGINRHVDPPKGRAGQRSFDVPSRCRALKRVRHLSFARICAPKNVLPFQRSY